MCKILQASYPSCGCKLIDIPPICCANITNTHSKQGLWTRTIKIEKQNEDTDKFSGRELHLNGWLYRIITESSHHILPWHECKEVEIREAGESLRDSRTVCPLHVWLGNEMSRQAASVERKDFASERKEVRSDKDGEHSSEQVEGYCMSGASGD